MNIFYFHEADVKSVLEANLIHYFFHFPVLGLNPQQPQVVCIVSLFM